jgi:hypothetical protein
MNWRRKFYYRSVHLLHDLMTQDGGRRVKSGWGSHASTWEVGSSRITVGARGSCGQARAFLCEQAELTKCLGHSVNKKINKTIFVSVCVLSPGVHLDHIIIFVATFFHVHKNYYAQADR